MYIYISAILYNSDAHIRVYRDNAPRSPRLVCARVFIFANIIILPIFDLYAFKRNAYIRTGAESGEKDSKGEEVNLIHIHITRERIVMVIYDQ